MTNNFHCINSSYLKLRRKGSETLIKKKLLKPTSTYLIPGSGEGYE